MTAITKPVRRETATLYRGRALIVTLHPRHLEMREARRHQSVTADLITLYEFLWKLRWMKTQAEKRAAKVAKRKRSQ
jgi:hypothetical protein